jgi:hypothetical protein
MSSFTAISNRALSLLGHGPIISLDDLTPESEEVKRVLPFVLDSVFRSHPWNCLVVRQSLAATSGTPVYEYSNSYALPSDCIRVLDVVTDNNDRYVVEGRNLLTNAGPEINLRYVKHSEDPNLYDGLLREAIATYLALTLCEKITQSNTKKQLLVDDFKRVILEARRVDGQENPPARFAADTWVTARHWL